MGCGKLRLCTVPIGQLHIKGKLLIAVLFPPRLKANARTHAALVTAGQMERQPRTVGNQFPFVLFPEILDVVHQVHAYAQAFAHAVGAVFINELVVRMKQPQRIAQAWNQTQVPPARFQPLLGVAFPRGVIENSRQTGDFRKLYIARA